MEVLPYILYKWIVQVIYSLIVISYSTWFWLPQLVSFVEKSTKAVSLETGLSRRMANQSRSGPAHLSRPSVSKELVHENKVHREAQEQSSLGHSREFTSPS